MEEENKNNNTEEEKNVDSAIADTILQYKQMAEEEKAKRIEAENKVLEMVKVLRNAEIQPAKPKEEKEKSAQELADKLFN